MSEIILTPGSMTLSELESLYHAIGTVRLDRCAKPGILAAHERIVKAGKFR